MLAQEPIVLQITTRNGGGGHFVSRPGRLEYRPGAHPSPQATQTWSSAGDALRVLTNLDEIEMLRAFEDGRCRMKGSFTAGLWFNEAMKIARQPTPKKGR